MNTKVRPVCSLPECDNPHKAKGYCMGHYLRWRLHGTPLGGGIQHHGLTLQERFEKYVDKVTPLGCWQWIGHCTAAGYGQFQVWPKSVWAHRVAYELAKGPIPDGLVIDHLCRNPGCVNPDHLEAVTIKENSYRGLSRPLVFCVNGHSQAEHAYIRSDGKRGYCKICQRAKERGRKRERRRHVRAI